MLVAQLASQLLNPALSLKDIIDTDVGFTPYTYISLYEMVFTKCSRSSFSWWWGGKAGHSGAMEGALDWDTGG